MGTRDSYAPGLFCWVDLSTTDTEAAKAFYGSLFGWTTLDVPRPSGGPASAGHATGSGTPYGFFQRDGATVAGLAELQPQAREAGMPPAWSSYVRVEDAEAVCRRAAELGGTVRSEPLAIGDSGRMAVLADPQGAIFLLWEPASFPGAAVVNTPGSFTWNDLQTTDPEAAVPFYRDLFGWEIGPTEGAAGQYFTINNGGRMNGGLMRSPVEGVPPYWMTYFGIEGLDGALERAKDGGGGVLAGPMQLPGGRIAVLRDPQGAVFSVFEGEYDD